VEKRISSINQKKKKIVTNHEKEKLLLSSTKRPEGQKVKAPA